MANEKNVVAGATTPDEKVQNVTMPKGLKLERELIRTRNGQPYTTKDGAMCYTYFVRCPLPGKEFKAELTAAKKDVDGYSLLDCMFDYGDVVLTREIVTQVNDGVKTQRTVYHAIGATPDGFMLDYELKATQSSDRSLLDVLFARLNNIGTAA